VTVRRATLLFDQGPGAGLGHRRRMEALAWALHAAGFECRLVPLEAGADDDARAVPGAAAPTLPDVPVVVVDSYRRRADELGAAGNGARLVVAVDDLFRDLAVDVVVDPSPGATVAPHRRARRVLAGADYTLVVPPSPQRRAVPAGGPVDRVLVTTGAADAQGVGAEVATAVKRVLPPADVRLVVGPWGAAADAEAHGVTTVVAPPSLADELAAAPVVVTAGGIAMLEACLLERCVVAMVVAENQRVAVEQLAAAGAVHAATPELVAATVARLAADPHARATVASAAAAVIDGHGADRVAAEVAGLLATGRVA
jgi:spore coat polysaccharide biosynthesis predicted glycosyltransferase SpsG